jgi:hypothetical protein
MKAYNTYINSLKMSFTIDEFGRDLSLKTRNSMFGDYFARFTGMSWAEMNDILEEEEEEEKMLENKKKQDAYRETLLKVLGERKELVEKGLYELEEGEELDL